MKQISFEYSDKKRFHEQLSMFSRQITGKVFFRIYSAQANTERIRDVCDILDEIMPDAPYAGCSSNGNILDHGFSQTDIAIVATEFEDPSSQVEVCQYDYTRSSASGIGENLIARIKPWVKAIELYVTSADFSSTGFCESLAGLRRDIQIFGGTACLKDISSLDSFVFSKGAACSSQAIVFLFYGGEHFFAESMHVTGWQPLGKKFYVTKASGSTLYELDGRPAYDAYYNYLNIANDASFFSNTLEFPLLYEHNNETILRVPLTSNPDGSLTMSSDIEVGSVLRLAYGNPRTIFEIIEKESQKLQSFLPDVLHIFSCAGRRSFWNSDDAAIRELRSFRSLAPISGFFTHGEFHRSKEHLNQHNVTLVIGAMREGEPDRIFHSAAADEQPPSRVPIVTRLSTFISAVASEWEKTNRTLEDAYLELEKINRKLAVMAITDDLTGLYNRREIQRRITETIENGIPFALLMMDLDNFKRINDSYGHKAGDFVLTEFSGILNALFSRLPEGCAAGRWGGEEFMFLLPDFDAEKAGHIAEEIRLRFSRHMLPDLPSQTVSIGVTQFLLSDDSDAICSRADAALYTAKKNGKNRICIL